MTSLIMFAIFIILMMGRIPVEIAVGLAAVSGVLIEGHSLTVVARTMVGSIDSFILVAVPFFILAGHLMNHGGVTEKIFAFARAASGHMRGGLAQVNIAASMLFAGMSGAAVADLAALGAVEIKAMRENGYSVEISSAVTLASCTIGPIIPPSIVFVVYGLMAEVSIGRLFLAGILPGAIIGLSLAGFVNYYARRYPEHFGPKEPFLFRNFLITFWDAKFELLSPVAIILLLITGVATPTEVGVFAVLYVLLLGVINRKLTWKGFSDSIMVTLGTTALIMYLIAVSTVFGDIVVQERAAENLAMFLGNISSNPCVVLIFINLFLIVVGMVVDNMPALIICSTMLLPVVKSAGVDPVHFGVIICFNLIIGIITPPMGIGLYIAARVSGISVERVIRAVLPFLIPLLVSLLVISAWPDLSLWLPDLVFGPAK